MFWEMQHTWCDANALSWNISSPIPQSTHCPDRCWQKTSQAGWEHSEMEVGECRERSRDAFCLPRGCRAFSARGAGYAELPTMLDRIDCSALPGSVKIAGNPLTGGVTMLQPFRGERSDIHLSRKCLEAVNSPRCQTLTYEKSLWLDPPISYGFSVWNKFGRIVSQTCCIYKYFADCQLLPKLGK